MGTPLVTIGLTCFNAEDTIERATTSALNQNWSNTEILIVDDCSSDASCEIVKTIIQDNPSVLLIKHENNCGVAAARNSILRKANGEFIVFFDDDDESMPDRIDKQINALTAYENSTGNNLVACYASGERSYPNGHKKTLLAIGSKYKDKPHGHSVADYLLYFKQNNNWFYGAGTPTCALLARTSTFIEVGKFDEKLKRVEDIDFAIRFALMGGHFIGTEEKLFVQYATDSLDKQPEINLEYEQKIVKKYRDYLSRKNKYYYAYHWPLLRYYHFKKQYLNFIMTFIGIFIRYPFISIAHLFKTGINRLIHEYMINKEFK